MVGCYDYIKKNCIIYKRMIIINDGVMDEVESFMIEIFELMCI